ncbi:ATP-binding protein [Neobacillus massiliamazoniensis]|uniref:histidine kinase n=1 Tax=Neobacillus massiliamazoniensis TaxID=1499688 RepID=A0A0U1NXJ9_9BACI|nr:ATP-binding protein [Neobacillus massiliamazoniensis]CRK82741.1 integral membrane sensor signal transduction histidine kinase [Neobacillus massiliamazoniensis]
MMKSQSKWLGSQPIRDKVVVFGILMSSIPLLLLSFYYFYHTKMDLEERIKEKQILVLKNLSTEITMDVNLTFQHLQKLALVYGSNQTDSEFYQLLQQNESIEEIVLTNENGIVVKRISRYKLNKPEKNEKWYSKEMWLSFQNNEKAYGNVELNEYGQPVVKLAVPFVENGKRKGVGVVLQLQKMVGKISSLRQDSSTYLYLMDSSGKVIAHQDFSKLWKKENPDTATSVLGVKEKFPGLNWTLVMEQPKMAAYKPINYMFQDGLLVVALLTCLVSLISIYAGLYFTKPIILLDKAMNKMKSGEKLHPLSVQQNDEIGKLVDSFNEMSREIHDKSRRIEQEKEQLNVVLEGIGAGLALVTKEYKITWMNSILKSLYEKDQFHLPCYQLIEGSKAPCKDCIITNNRIEDNANKLFTLEDRFGDKRIFRHRVFPLTHVMDGEGEFVLFIEDITKEKKIEEKIVQTDKLAALGLMASSFAHEVNNPLTTINVYSEDLLDRMNGHDPSLDDAEMSIYLKKIKDNTERCKQITANLLNFSRKTNWTISSIDLEDTLQNAISLVEYPLRKKKITLHVQLGDIPDFHGDRLKLMQVLVNLLNNSIDSIEEDGTISILGEMKNRELNLIIRDSGEGIRKEDLPKIFDPFYTTKPIGKGTGLGLSVCYGIIQQFGGTIQFSSELGKGTTVELKIPIQTKQGREHHGNK